MALNLRIAMGEFDTVVSTTLPRAVVAQIDSHVTRELSRAGVLRGAIMSGLATLAGERVTDNMLILGSFRLVREQLARIEALLPAAAPAAPQPPQVACSSGAGWAVDAEAADRLRAQGAMVLAHQSWVLVTGETSEGEPAHFIVCAASNSLTIAVNGEGGKSVSTGLEGGDLFSVCELIEGSLRTARATFDTSTGTWARPVGGELEIGGLSLVCCAGGGPAGPSLSMGGLTIRVSDVALMQGAAELRSLTIRVTCEAIKVRQGLDTALAGSAGASVEAI